MKEITTRFATHCNRCRFPIAVGERAILGEHGAVTHRVACGARTTQPNSAHCKTRPIEDYARRYIRAGFAVLPIKLGEKQPDADRAPRGVYSATRDIGIAHEWFAFTVRNIGIAVPEDVLVVDIDPKNGGIETMAALVKKNGKLPTTPRQRSGSGGVHLMFAHPGGEIRGKLGDGVDLLRVGRYIVVAPSLHPSGRHYAWIVAPWEVAFAPMPVWLADACRRPAPPQPPSEPRRTPTIDRVRAYVAKMDAAISGQGGHPQTFAVACVICANIADYDEQFALIAEYNQRCEPKWSRRELEHKLDDARRADLRPLADRPRKEHAA